jgi:anti-sigma factor ChrR (cupin superfamily)
MAEQTTMKKVINPPGLESHYIDVENMPWEPLGPGSYRKVLFHDPVTDMQTWLCKIAPGGVIPFHEHPGIEQTFVLDGSFADDEGICTPGNFVWRPAGSRHIGRAPNGVTFLAFFTKPSKRLPPE